jgi:hypothetical protein
MAGFDNNKRRENLFSSVGNISTIFTTSTFANLSVNLRCFGGDPCLVVKILPPLFMEYLHHLALNLSSISYPVEMVEVVEIFFG